MDLTSYKEKVKKLVKDSILDYKYIDKKEKNGKTIYIYEDEAKQNKRIIGQEAINKYIKDYVAKNPEIKQQAKQYEKALQTIKTFKVKTDGTYSLDSAMQGKAVKKDYKDGYQVSFHQNSPDGKLAYYNDETYALLIAIAKKELKDDVDIGCFNGDNEISIYSKEFDKVRLYGSKHNQHSMYDWKREAEEKAKGNKEYWIVATRVYGKEELERAKRINKKYNVV